MQAGAASACSARCQAARGRALRRTQHVAQHAQLHHAAHGRDRQLGVEAQVEPGRAECMQRDRIRNELGALGWARQAVPLRSLRARRERAGAAAA